MTVESFSWDVDQYGLFADFRRRPALELLSRIRHPDPKHIHELGCGSGEMSRLMAKRWANARVTGSDTSAEMLAEAASVESNVIWERLDLRHWEPASPQDVIFANAVLHWVPDHHALVPRLVDHLAPGGVLAVQMPLSWHEPSHRGILGVLEELDLGSERLRERYRHSPVAEPAWYVELLQDLVTEIDVWTTRYFQVLEGADPIVEWVRGTGLRPVLDELDGDDLNTFMASYAALMRQEYPRGRRGRTVYPFPRLFIVATR